jgi:hypothetical protein
VIDAATGNVPLAERLDNHEAARWLLHTDHELPKGLASLAEEA